MGAVGGVLSAFGLATSAGLNACVPLLLVALVARFTDWIKLGATGEPMTGSWVMCVLLVPELVESFADQIPAVNQSIPGIQPMARYIQGVPFTVPWRLNARNFGDLIVFMVIATDTLGDRIEPILMDQIRRPS